ncbi:MAG: right-handed parallel beta-helix repeat-containing protein [Candidatus Bathyarchaeota archaeon]|nr:right-handed parallel beta-helix repeat-containing protein [Candidatus Bathyarchaeota archaeon]
MHVYDGTYNENVIITKNGLSVIAASSPVLDGTGLGTSGFLLMADHIQINGFTIQNFMSPTAGIAGIELRGANHCWLHHNEMKNNNYGIVFGDSTMTTYPSNDYNLIEYNSIHNNNPSSPWYYTGIGIMYWYGTSSHTTVYMNEIYDHDRNAILAGQHERYNPDSVGYGGHSYWQIIKNNIGHSGWYAIEITNGLYSVIQENTVTNAGIGILVQAWDYSAHHILVDKNEIQNSGTGIYLVTQNTTKLPLTTLGNINVTNNKIYSCTSYGVNTWSTSTAQISNCIISNNIVHDTGSIGMYLINLQDSTVKYNNVYKINHVGLYLASCDNTYIRYNEVYNCTYSGIQLLNTASSRAEHNTVYYNGYSGIYVHNGCTNILVKSNNVHDNCIGSLAGTAGIKVISDGTTLEYNLIENNKLDGLYVTSDNNIILRNTILGNTGAYSGIHLTNTADGNEIHYNCIVGNT